MLIVQPGAYMCQHENPAWESSLQRDIEFLPFTTILNYSNQLLIVSRKLSILFHSFARNPFILHGKQKHHADLNVYYHFNAYGSTFFVIVAENKYVFRSRGITVRISSSDFSNSSFSNLSASSKICQMWHTTHKKKLALKLPRIIGNMNIFTFSIFRQINTSNTSRHELEAALSHESITNYHHPSQGFAKMETLTDATKKKEK